jgi:hypothetical protein
MCVMGVPVHSVTVVLFAGMFVCCARPAQVQHPSDPAWLTQAIAKIEQNPVTTPPSSIWRYSYRGAPVYFVPAPCCDQFSDLFDDSGTLLCHPGGGLSGTGDGKCSDFLRSRSGEQLIWRDQRKP